MCSGFRDGARDLARPARKAPLWPRDDRHPFEKGDPLCRRYIPAALSQTSAEHLEHAERDSWVFSKKSLNILFREHQKLGRFGCSHSGHTRLLFDDAHFAKEIALAEMGQGHLLA
jgi:hypothetical protein